MNLDDVDLQAALSWERCAEGVAAERARRESPEGRAERDAVRDLLGWY